MPDAITLLKKDHREVEGLFSKFEQTGDATIAKKLCQELEVHTTIEEEIVYPVLRRKVDQDLAKEAQKEHDEADQIIKKIQSTLSDGRGGNQLAALMSQLKEAVEHHVEEEETEVFPKMQQKVGDQLTSMGQAVAQRKQELLQLGGAVDLLDLTKEELYERAKRAGIEGRSDMTKEELAKALQKTR
jgi:iron-sulfur cluster repair protein YtfE (RIC family)